MSIDMHTEDKEKDADELDLWDLFKKMWLAIKKLFVYLLRRSIWFAIFIVIGVIFCVFQSSKDKKYYSSTIQFRSNNINSALIISQINALDNLLKEQKYDKLALILQTPKDVVEEIKSIKGLYALDVDRDKHPDFADVKELVNANPRDTTLGKMNDYFYVKLDVYSDKPFTNILQGLRDYISRDEFLKRENEYAISQQKQMLATIKDQVSLLDSFQRVDYFKRDRVTASQQLYLIDEKGKFLYHLDYIDLYEKQQKFEKNLEFYCDVITPTQGFSPLTTPENSFTFYLKKSIWWFLLLGFVCALLWDNRKFLLSNILGKKRTS